MMRKDTHKCAMGRRRFLKMSAALGVAGLSSEVLGMIPSDYKEPPVTDGLRRKALEGELPQRPLGKTGEKLSILAFGGFHLLEVSESEADELLNFYLDAGGNFIETAIAYGDGDSERKIGRVMKERRDECFLSTKVYFRDRKSAAQSIDRSLRHLNTDHVDNLFMHAVSTEEDLERVMSDDGALRAAEDARAAGKVRFISITSHLPEVLLMAVKSYPFDAVMEWINYYDYFNFPIIYNEIIPACVERGIGIICMKPLADGLLYRPESAANAFRWVWSMEEVTCAAAGNNTMYQLASNLALAKDHRPMTAREKQNLYLSAPELANYVCRRCRNCMPNKAGLDIPEIHRLEGYFDRQMMPGPVMTLPDEDLREGLNNWFDNRAHARAAYAALDRKVTADTDCSDVEARCPYELPITAKLKWIHQKLTA
ncbi:MAG: aldo/keto reductase [Candidatus Brocadiae bacterium]|nr:aldo/keto reductase [Candidatus Brocadiia bacterium]